MDFASENIKVDIGGKGNVASLKRDFIYTSIEEIATLPALEADDNLMADAITMRAAAGQTTAGKFAKIEGSEVDCDYKCEALGEGDNNAGVKVSVKLFINGKSSKASHLLMKLRNRRLALVVTERDGTKVFIYDITLKYGAQVNPKKGYMLEGETTMADEPPVITSALIMA
jgi:hypothetical protein